MDDASKAAIVLPLKYSNRILDGDRGSTYCHNASVCYYLLRRCTGLETMLIQKLPQPASDGRTHSGLNDGWQRNYRSRQSTGHSRGAHTRATSTQQALCANAWN